MVLHPAPRTAALRIHFINVGYGDSILVEEFDRGQRVFSMLVDAGPPSSGAQAEGYRGYPGRITSCRYLRSLGLDRLDLVVLSHFHLDHIGGMPELLETMPFGELWANYAPVGKPAFLPSAGRKDLRGASLGMSNALLLLDRLQTISSVRGKPLREIREDRFDLALTRNLGLDLHFGGEGVYSRMAGHIKALGPSLAAEELDSRLFALDQLQNEASLSLRLKYCGLGLLLAADAPPQRWDRLLDEGHPIRSDILKFPHHGRLDAVSPRFAEGARPSQVVFCVSEDNPFGCPSPEIFGYFPEATRFYSTGRIDSLPRLERGPERSALVFQVEGDGGIGIEFARPRE
jgi:beta-lactamase superfamily II metal-dependent hydrolase